MAKATGVPHQAAIKWSWLGMVASSVIRVLWQQECRRGRAISGSGISGRATSGRAMSGRAISGRAISGEAISGNAINGRAIGGLISILLTLPTR